MDLRRLRAGEWLAAVAGLALIASLFLPWYEGSFGGVGAQYSGGDPEFTGWEALTVLDVVFVAGGLAGVAILVVTATQRTPALPVALGAIAVLVGLIVVALVLYRVLDVPGLETGGPAEAYPDGDRRVGLWTGLLAALGLTAGSFLSMRDERLSRPGESTDLTGRPVPPPPEIDPLPPPGAAR